MGFVYEEVGEENRELWESIGWKDWLKSPMPFCPVYEWCIDKEQQIYMQAIGRFRDMPDYYDLFYKDRIVRMEISAEGSSGTRAIGFNMSWNVYRIYIPKSIWKERTEILKAIEAAFHVDRGGHAEDLINSISVQISCEPECVEVDYNGK
ncbi:MAG: hypothetical protein J1F42_13570 [Lachnospiraceae bacterium]|nr:hypothetical protein [Lachnospiraceae bacterium]